jgi:hypothetical protein
MRNNEVMSDPYDPNAAPPPGQGPGRYGPPPYGQQGYSQAAPDHPQGTVVLVLGIVGIFVGICAPFAWYLGSKALKEIRASGQTYANEQQIVIGRILGIVITILMIAAVAISIIVAIIAIIAAANAR